MRRGARSSYEKIRAAFAVDRHGWAVTLLRDARPDERDAIGEMMVAAYEEYMPPDPSAE
jgi:hypothetical protein